MIRWWEHSEKGGRDGRRDGQTDNTICRAAWSQLKTYRLKTFADLRRRWRSCVTRIGHTAAADAPVGSCIQLSHLYASVPPVYFCCSWISWSSRNFRQRSWLHCDSYWSLAGGQIKSAMLNWDAPAVTLGNYPDSKIHGADMGPIWGRQDPGGPHVGPMNFAIWQGRSTGTKGWGMAFVAWPFLFIFFTFLDSIPDHFMQILTIQFQTVLHWSPGRKT